MKLEKHFSVHESLTPLPKALSFCALILDCGGTISSKSHRSSLCMDTAQWPQEIGLVKPMEEMEMVPSSSTMVATASNITRPQMMERRTRPQKEQALNCPRCNSTNTKFCYYNNYSLTQPRYFCKTCRRYWTEGGSLRNVPVGGGSRKNKRSSSSSTTNTPTSAVSTSKKMTPDHLTPPPSISLSSASQNPKFHEGQDLNLAFRSLQPEFGGNNTSSSAGTTMNCSNPGAASGALSAMELLRSGMSGRGLGHFMPMQMSMADAGAVYSSGFVLQDYRPPTLSFPLDVTGGAGGGGGGGGGGGNGNGCGNMQGVQDGAGRLLFPFEDLKPLPTSRAGQFEQNREQGGHDHPGYWNGMLGGGGGGGSW